MTQLRTYLKETKTKQADLAKVLGVSFGYMSEIVSGAKRPSLDLAFAIERATGGAVSAASWVTSSPKSPEKDVA